MPERIQLRRTKGWRKPEGAIIVARPSKWGNPFRVNSLVHCSSAGRKWTRQMSASDAVSFFEVGLRAGEAPFTTDDIRRELRGHDLACWCPLVDEHGNRVPCHADVLLEIANQEAIA